MSVEFLTWSVNVSTVSKDLKRNSSSLKRTRATSAGKRRVFDSDSGKSKPISTYLREGLAPGMRFNGPALVAEPQTTTLVPRGWRCVVAAAGHLVLDRTA